MKRWIDRTSDEREALVVWSRKWWSYIKEKTSRDELLDHDYLEFPKNRNITYELAKDNNCTSIYNINTMPQMHHSNKMPLECLQNPNITFEYVMDNIIMNKTHANISKIGTYLSQNPSINLNDIKLLYQYWDWSQVPLNPTFTFDMIKGIPINHINWRAVSNQPNVTWDIIVSNPTIKDADGSVKPTPWDWYGISYNKNITWEIIHTNPTIHNEQTPWAWNGISMNPNITWEIIKSNPQCPWDWWCISLNPNITMDIVLANPDEEWEWYCIGKKMKNISWEYVEANKHLPWEWDGLLMNNQDEAREKFIKDYVIQKHMNEHKKKYVAVLYQLMHQ
jgi:hypothetical protein